MEENSISSVGSVRRLLPLHFSILVSYHSPDGAENV